MRLFGFGKKQRPEHVVLMLVSGWVYEWDLMSVTRLGGNGRANDIAVHKDILYEADPSGVISWQTQDFVFASRGWTTAVCSHAGNLYHASYPGPGLHQSVIFETLTGKEIARRGASVSTLCSHNGRLYDGGLEGVFDTFSNRKFIDRHVNVLCSHDGGLYDGAFMGVNETLSDREVAYRDCDVVALCSYRGVLYDATKYSAVRDTMRCQVALEYGSVIHNTKTRVVMGWKLKGGRQKVITVYGMITVSSDLVMKWQSALREYWQAIEREQTQSLRRPCARNPDTTLPGAPRSC